MHDWDDLRFFLAVARQPSLARAAKQLKVNKSTAFRRVAALEKRLGARLLDVSARGHVLTADGRRLLERAEVVEAAIHSAERELIGSDAGLVGEVTLTTTDMLMREILAPRLADFSLSHSRICINVVTDNRMLKLTDGEAEVAVRQGEAPTEPDVVARRICRVASAFYASRRYVEARGRPQRREQLSEHSIVGVDRELSHLPSAKLIAKLLPTPHTVVRCSDLGSHVAACESGLGVALLPCFVADRKRPLLRLFPPEASLSTSLWLIWHRELRQSARVKALLAHLRQTLELERPLFEGAFSQPA